MPAPSTRQRRGFSPSPSGEATKTRGHRHRRTQMLSPSRSASGRRPTPTMPKARWSPHPSLRPATEEIEAALDAFRGDILQVPPQYSAVRVDGARAYDLARDGETMDLGARPLHVETLDVVGTARRPTMSPSRWSAARAVTCAPSPVTSGRARLS